MTRSEDGGYSPRRVVDLDNLPQPKDTGPGPGVTRTRSWLDLADKIERVTVADIQPGDVVIFETDESCTLDDAVEMAETWKATTGLANHVVVLHRVKLRDVRPAGRMRGQVSESDGDGSSPPS